MTFCAFLCLSLNVSAQPDSTATPKVQTDSTKFKGRAGAPRGFLFEIQDVHFSGNKFFGDEALFAVIDSRNTDLGFFQYIIRYYGEHIKTIKAAPLQMRRAFDNVLRDMQGEIQYYNAEVAKRDADAIENLYNKSGFHWTKVTFRYGIDTATLIKTLTFDVAEGDQARLDTVVYSGIDSLPEPVLKEVLKSKTYTPGNIYSETDVLANINQAFKTLQDSGYFYSKYDQPKVTVLSETKSDSVFVQFTTGKRQQISRIFVTDSLQDQSVVSGNMKRLQLEFQEGEWYNRTAIERSINNLYELTTFDAVSIDTISREDNSDTTISLEVLLRYRKQNEISGGLSVNRTTFDNYTNLGLDITYINRNIFGAAQNLTIFFRPQLLNLSRVFDQAFEVYESDSLTLSDIEYDWEIQTGLQIAQPYLFSGLGARWSGSAQYLYSLRYLVRPLQLSTNILRPTITGKFVQPIVLGGYLDNLFNINIFNKLDVYDQLIGDISLESQVPINYERAEDLFRTELTRDEDERALVENLYIYKQLNNYDNFLTSIIGSVTAIADRRDDFFNPSKGYYTTAAIDHGLLLSDFTRSQFILTFFQPFASNIIFGYKARFGKIWWRDRGNSYVPFERHFFAGGSNSVRGWPSRELRAPIPSDTAQTTNTNELRILRDLVGSGTIIEGSFEARWSFGKQKAYFLSDIVSEMGLVGFADIGNTFHRLTPDAYNVEVPWKDYLLKLGIAAGLGLRYNTPVGPLRLDVATRLYDPLIRRPNFKHIQLHIGLGHAF